MNDVDFMKQALEEAQKAFQSGEVPVGAVLVRKGEVIGRGHNLRESLQDPTAHAEIIAIREGASVFKSWRLSDTALYVTLEPCPMCAGAIIQARIEWLIFGAKDPKWGAAGTVVDILSNKHFNHLVEVRGGVLEEESKILLKSFFLKKRRLKKE